MAKDTTKVAVEKMIKKDFKKETGYDDLIRKVYEKAKSAKTKALTAIVSVPKMTFQPGKGKAVVPVIMNNKIKTVKKGPAKDRVVVLAIEGEGKKKTRVIALRFASEDEAKLFYDTAKLKGVKPPEELAPAPVNPPSMASPATTATNRRSPPPPLTPSPSNRSRANSMTQTMTDRRISPSRSPSPPPARTVPPAQRRQSMTSTTSRNSINDMHPAMQRSASSSRTLSHSPISHPAPTTTTSPSRSPSRQPKSATRRRSSSSSSSSYSRRRSKSPAKNVHPAYQQYSEDTKTSFISTEPADFYAKNGNPGKSRSRLASSNGYSSAYNSYESDRGTHRSRRSDSVRILQLVPGKSSSRLEPGRMYYYSARGSSTSSSSSSSSRSSSSSSSESIATRWTNNPGRSSSYRVQGNDDYVELSPRARRRRYSSASSSSRSSSSSRASTPRIVGQWRIQRIDSYSSSSSSSSSVSPIRGGKTIRPQVQRHRSNPGQAYRLTSR